MVSFVPFSLSLAIHFIFGKSTNVKYLKQLLQFYYSYDNDDILVIIVSLYDLGWNSFIINS